MLNIGNVTFGGDVMTARTTTCAVCDEAVTTRKVDRLTTVVRDLEKQLTEAKAELATAVRRADYLSQSPDLPAEPTGPTSIEESA